MVEMDMDLPEKAKKTSKVSVLLFASVVVAGYCFIRYHTPYADTGVLVGFLKCSIADWGSFMRDPDYLEIRWYFGKPIFFVYTIIFRYLLPLRYEFLAAFLFALILLNGYLSKLIFTHFFSTKNAFVAAIFYTFLLYVTFWLCVLRNEIYLITITHIVLLNCLRFCNTGRIRLFFFNIALVMGIALPIHPNSFYIGLFLLLFFIVFKIYRTHLWSTIVLVGIFGLLGMVILLYPSFSEFMQNMKYLSTRDGQRFRIGIKFFQILGVGFYKNGYQYPFVVSAFVLSLMNFKKLVPFFKKPSPQQKIFLLYFYALCFHFLFVPSATWKIYSVYFVFPLAFWMMYILEGGFRTRLNIPFALIISFLLIVPVIREYHFLDKAGVIIPCVIFILLLLFNRFRFNLKLIYVSMILFLCINFFQLYCNHRYYSDLSSVLRQTGATEFVTSPMFELLGKDYDVRMMSKHQNIMQLQDSWVVMLDKSRMERYDIQRQPDRHFLFENMFIPKDNQEWFLFLPPKQE